jgi:hypothetical protein
VGQYCGPRSRPMTNLMSSAAVHPVHLELPYERYHKEAPWAASSGNSYPIHHGRVGVGEVDAELSGMHLW